MSRPRLIVILSSIAVVVVAAVIAVVIVVANNNANSVKPLSRVVYTQSKAVPGFDTSPHIVTDSAKLQALRDVLVKDNWKPSSGGVGLTTVGCTGGTTTHFSLTFSDKSTAGINVYDCGSTGNTLSKDLTKLVSSWKK